VFQSALLFVVASAALLGSPGPGIAALMAVGRTRGVAGGLTFFLAMQLGLAIAAGLSALGLSGLLRAFPVLHSVLTVVSVIYLLWLAWAIASAPLSGGVGDDAPSGALTLWGGFLLGVANPKAYLAFASLFGSFTVFGTTQPFADGVVKWVLCVVVMAVVDLAWMMAGVALGRIALSPRSERLLNISMGAAVLVACVAAVL
jgi:threonine/homoserine/homoserine lactone efflux protein